LAHPRGCKNSIDVFQATTDATRSICLEIVQPRTSMIQDDDAMSVFTHSGPFSACREGLKSRSMAVPVREGIPCSIAWGIIGSKC
jgi:hypothetical protein